MKIELENTEYFNNKSPRKNAFIDILKKKFGGLLSKSPKKSDNRISKVFDLNDREDIEKEENSSDEDRKQSKYYLNKYLFIFIKMLS